MKRTPGDKARWFSQFLYGLSLFFFVFGVINLGWAVWPAPTDGVQYEIPAGALPGAPEGEIFASQSRFALNVSWPRWLRRGESEMIHLRLTDLDQRSVPAGGDRAVQVILAEPALYPLPVTPSGGMQAALGDDQELLLSWEVEGTLRGSFTGKLYVSFGFYDQALADLVPVPVAVADINIRVVELWGLDAGLAIWFGIVSLVLWGALFLLGRVVVANS
jgi:hypothetical protein